VKQLGLALVLLHLGAALLALLPQAWPHGGLLGRLMADGWPLVLPVAAAIGLALPVGGLAGLLRGLGIGASSETGLPPLLASLGALPLLLAARMEPEEPSRAWWLALLLPALAGLFQAGRTTGAGLAGQGFTLQARLRGAHGLALALTLLPHATAPLLAAAARQAALLLLALATLSAIGMPVLPQEDWGSLLLQARGNGGPREMLAVVLPALWLCSLAAGLLLLAGEDRDDA
jgi:ABC-type dipeptide/oligopeptide/nickel transport system permease subunit